MMTISEKNDVFEWASKLAGETDCDANFLSCWGYQQDDSYADLDSQDELERDDTVYDEEESIDTYQSYMEDLLGWNSRDYY